MDFLEDDELSYSLNSHEDDLENDVIDEALLKDPVKNAKYQQMMKELQDIKITSKDLVLPPFRDKPMPRRQVFRPKDLPDAQILLFDSYLSTPRFIKRLTTISEELITHPNQQQYLRERLREMNEQLPGAVYIPFLSQSMRSYAVLSIVVEEARIFKTKERAPVLLTLEVFRPVELVLQRTPMYVQVSQLLQ